VTKDISSPLQLFYGYEGELTGTFTVYLDILGIDACRNQAGDDSLAIIIVTDSAEKTGLDPEPLQSNQGRRNRPPTLLGEIEQFGFDIDPGVFSNPAEQIPAALTQSDNRLLDHC